MIYNFRELFSRWSVRSPPFVAFQMMLQSFACDALDNYVSIYLENNVSNSHRSKHYYKGGTRGKLTRPTLHAPYLVRSLSRCSLHQGHVAIVNSTFQYLFSISTMHGSPVSGLTVSNADRLPHAELTASVPRTAVSCLAHRSAPSFTLFILLLKSVYEHLQQLKGT